MNLTARQKILNMRITEYFRKTKKPVHHSKLAAALGLSKITTYQLLKMLEKKGWLQAVYTLDSPGTKGRSKVTFIPTEKNIRLNYKPVEGYESEGIQFKEFLVQYTKKMQDGDFKEVMEILNDVLKQVSEEEPSLAPREIPQNVDEEWQELHDIVHSTLNRKKKIILEHLLYELIALIGTRTSPLTCCYAVIITTMFLISRTKLSKNTMDEITHLIERSFARENMSILVGLAWGLSVSSVKLQKIVGEIDDSVKHYEECVNVLTSDDLDKLHHEIKELWRLIQEKMELRTIFAQDNTQDGR